MAQSQALHGVELRDLVLRGHHVQLHGTPSRAFTLVGRLDSWEVGAQWPPLTPIFRPWGLWCPQRSAHSPAGLCERSPGGYRL